MSKGHSKYGPKFPFIKNLKKSAWVSKQDMLELTTLCYDFLILICEINA